MSSWLLGSSIRRSAVALLVATLAWVAPAAAADISGTVFDNAGDGGRVYLKVMWADQDGNPLGETNFGTSIDGGDLYATGEETFLIRGVPAGYYVIGAFMDVAETGVPYASSPVGMSSLVPLTEGGADSVELTLEYPLDIPPPGDAFIDGAIPGDQMAAVFVELPQDGFGFFTADTVNICWDTAPEPTGEQCASVPVQSDELDFVISDLTNGQAYRVVVSTSLEGTDGNQAEVFVTPATPGPGVTVSGLITFSGFLPSPGTPVYVALIDESEGGNAVIARFDAQEGVSEQPFSISGVSPGNYFVYGIADLSGDNVFGYGDAQVYEAQAQILAVQGDNIDTADVTLIEAPAFAFASTDHYKGASSEGYNLSFELEGSFLQPVRVALVSGPAGPLGPVDLGLSRWGGFSLWQSDVARPTVGDTYTFAVDYSDGSNNTVEATVQAVLDSFPTLISPLGPSLNATQPTFEWAAPASPPAPFYAYDFQLWDQNGNRWWEEWDIPSEQTSFAYPEGNPLWLDLNYSWTASVVDRFGNSATAVGEFTPVETLPNTLPSQIGVFRAGKWYLDVDGSHDWNAIADQLLTFGQAGDVPFGVDLNGDGVQAIGIFRAGKWYVDANENGTWDGTAGGDEFFTGFGMAGDIPVVADWNGDQQPEMAIFRGGKWYVDMNNSNSWDPANGDQVYTFGMAGDIPVPADFDGDGDPDMAIFRGGKWYVDSDGSRSWTGGADQVFTFGLAGDMPVVGDWDQSGTLRIGIFRAGKWYIDVDGDRAWNSLNDSSFFFGLGGDIPFTFAVPEPAPQPQ